MIKISCYKTHHEALAKTFCQLAYKCYLSSVNTCVITDSEELTQELDKILWTFSKKYFIPHATDKDPLPEKQPIFITNTIINPNNSKILVVINPSMELLINIISKEKIFADITKILIIIDDNISINFKDINNIFIKSHFEAISIDFFERDLNNSWQEMKDVINKISNL
ncbi:MAG: hypothetical protein EKK61_02610 [Rickettsiales bacterium]|nr:MAG: hypothetical protein EKK61_02610 [Rickettsiales bacterium]